MDTVRMLAGKANDGMAAYKMILNAIGTQMPETVVKRFLD